MALEHWYRAVPRALSVVGGVVGYRTDTWRRLPKEESSTFSFSLFSSLTQQSRALCVLGLVGYQLTRYVYRLLCMGTSALSPKRAAWSPGSTGLGKGGDESLWLRPLPFL